MAPGDVRTVETGDVTDVSYVDTGMYGTDEYGAVYLVEDDRPAVVDTGIGAETDRVFELLAARGVDPGDLAAILLTHVHLDHAGGAGTFARETDATVYVHERGARHLVDPSRLWAGTKAAVGDQIRYYEEPDPVPGDRVVELADGDSVDLGTRDLSVHAAPGHAPHQVVFESPADDAVFVADAAGIHVPSLSRVEPTTPPPQFDLDLALEDVQTLQSLDRSTLLYPHFGPAPTGDRLREYAAVLRWWVGAVEAASRELDGDALVDFLADRTDTDRVWGAFKSRAETRLNVRGALDYLDGRE